MTIISRMTLSIKILIIIIFSRRIPIRKLFGRTELSRSMLCRLTLLQKALSRMTLIKMTQNRNDIQQEDSQTKVNGQNEILSRTTLNRTAIIT
jgi:hypothetical protein